MIRETVLNDAAPFTPLLIERARGETQLLVKEVKSNKTTRKLLTSGGLVLAPDDVTESRGVVNVHWELAASGSGWRAPAGCSVEKHVETSARRYRNRLGKRLLWQGTIKRFGCRRFGFH